MRIPSKVVLGLATASAIILGHLGCAHRAQTTASPIQTAVPAAAAPATGAGHSEPAVAATERPVGRPAGAPLLGKMPSPVGLCAGQYTDEARRAGLEGTVILDVVVGEDGWVRDVTMVQGLAQGLGEAAVRAIKSCRFTPGERDGKPVAVRVRRFKVVFSLGEAK